jgi:hypothetical protein
MMELGESPKQYESSSESCFESNDVCSSENERDPRALKEYSSYVPLSSHPN